MNKVLVTGSSGYLGGVLSKTLKDSGYHVIGLDRRIGNSQFTSEFFKVDLLNFDNLRGIFNGLEDIDCVFHLAGLISVGESVKYPTRYLQNNCSSTANLLECMVLRGIDKIIFSSSAGIYKPQTYPLKETSEVFYNNPYAISKIICEDLIRQSGIRYVNLRYFNISGDTSYHHENHFPETHLIPNILNAIIDYKSFVLNGTDFETYDGSCVRDFVHVKDVADAHILALDYLKSGHISANINIGSGIGTSVKDVLNAFSRHTDEPVSVVNGERRPGDPSILVADISMAKSLLGYTPQYTLNDIIESVL